MYAIGLRHILDNTIHFLSSGMYKTLEENIKQAEEWYDALNDKNYEIFIVPSDIVDGKLHYPNHVHLDIYHRYKVWTKALNYSS